MNSLFYMNAIWNHNFKSRHATANTYSIFLSNNNVFLWCYSGNASMIAFKYSSCFHDIELFKKFGKDLFSEIFFCLNRPVKTNQFKSLFLFKRRNETRSIMRNSLHNFSSFELASKWISIFKKGERNNRAVLASAGKLCLPRRSKRENNLKTTKNVRIKIDDFNTVN